MPPCASPKCLTPDRPFDHWELMEDYWGPDVWWWDEFWVEGTDHRVWISVDEGDVILQRPIPRNDCPANTKPPKLGDTVTAERRNYRVTEASSAICIAVRGHFSEILKIGSQYDYVNCTGENGNLLSGEFSEGAPDWYLGAWLDPFEFTVGIEK